MHAAGTPSKPWPGWAHALLGALIFGAALGVALAAQQRATARKAWPLMQATLARLSTDEGARDLWARNPAIHGDYEDEADFLAQVRAGRQRMGGLPSVEPTPQARSAWFRAASPWNVWAVAQGDRGGLVQIQLQRQGLLTAPEGEGYTLVHFSPDWEGLREIRAARRNKRRLAHWQELRRVADRVASPQGSRQLWEAEHALHANYPTWEAFEAEAAQARCVLQHLPQDPSEAEPRLHISRVRNPFMDRVDLQWEDEEGHAVALRWENGALVIFKRLG